MNRHKLALINRLWKCEKGERLTMAKNSSHRWPVLFSRVHNPSINDSSPLISYWPAVVMERRNFIRPLIAMAAFSAKRKPLSELCLQLQFSRFLFTRDWATRGQVTKSILKKMASRNNFLSAQTRKFCLHYQLTPFVREAKSGEISFWKPQWI